MWGKTDSGFGTTEDNNASTPIWFPSFYTLHQDQSDSAIHFLLSNIYYYFFEAPKTLWVKGPRLWFLATTLWRNEISPSLQQHLQCFPLRLPLNWTERNRRLQNFHKTFSSNHPTYDKSTRILSPQSNFLTIILRFIEFLTLQKLLKSTLHFKFFYNLHLILKFNLKLFKI